MGLFDFLFKKTNHSSKSKENAYLAVFSADWCGPSKKFLNEIKNAGITNISIIDTDKEEDLTNKFQILSIPTTILFDENLHEIKKWIGYDDKDPGQTKFVNYIKKSEYNILPFSAYPYNPIAHKSVMETIESIVGTDEKPAKVEKQILADGSTYTGEARLGIDGKYIPMGFGKKILNKEVEMTGNWVDGYVNGVCYMNMHFAMITGHFVNNHPDGWCLSVDKNGYVFGVFKDDDCCCSLGEAVLWMMRNIGMNIKMSSTKKMILLGDKVGDTIKGFQFLNNGDIYVGVASNHSTLTGYFFKFSHDGYIQTGLFEEGVLVENLDPKKVVEANGMDSSLLKVKINPNKKYF